MKTKLLLSLLALGSLTLHAQEDDPFLILNTSVNESFIKVIAKNRASSAESASNFSEINTKEEFLEALESNQKPINQNRFKTQYIYTEIKNVNIKKDDLKEIQGKTLNLGTDVKRGRVSKVLNIKNSKIETDKDINLAINLDAEEENSATSFTQIKDSQLIGGSGRLDNSLAKDSLVEESDDLLPLNMPSH